MLARVRPRLRDVVSDLLFASGVTDPARRHAGRLTIVTFHRVLPEDLRTRYPYPGIAVTPDELAFCLGYFREHYACGTLRDVHARFVRGDSAEKPLLAVSFDDGTLDNFEHAAPVLERAGIRATFFVPVRAVSTGEPLWHDRLGFALMSAGGEEGSERALDRAVREAKALDPATRRAKVADAERRFGSEVPAWAAMMDLDRVRKLARAGHEIGSHSMTHPLLPQCATDEKRYELVESKAILEREIGSDVLSIAYPNGDCDEATEDATAKAGYEVGVTTQWGTNPRGAPPLLLRRCDMDARKIRRAREGPLSESLLAWRMSGLHPRLRSAPYLAG